MLYGEYEHALDPKGRLIIPAKFRQALKAHDVNVLFLTRGLDRCLFLFPEAEWRALESKFKQLSVTKGEARKFNRLFFSGATEVTFDGLGRILLPRHLKEFAHIKTQVTVVGVSTRMEIWAKEQWQAYYESARENFEEVAEKLMLEP